MPLGDHPGADRDAAHGRPSIAVAATAHGRHPTDPGSMGHAHHRTARASTRHARHPIGSAHRLGGPTRDRTLVAAVIVRRATGHRDLGGSVRRQADLDPPAFGRLVPAPTTRVPPARPATGHGMTTVDRPRADHGPARATVHSTRIDRGPTGVQVDTADRVRTGDLDEQARVRDVPSGAGLRAPVARPARRSGRAMRRLPCRPPTCWAQTRSSSPGDDRSRKHSSRVDPRIGYWSSRNVGMPWRSSSCMRPACACRSSNSKVAP